MDPEAPTTDGQGSAGASFDRIGAYHILGKIGEGGFGIVYEAEQDKPIKRRVALKVVKPGMDSKAIVARFEAERQALAMMNHPCVAKVFDGGTTDRGRPYFVMELVKGDPITTFCDTHTFSIEERIELFIRVCHAIQHAHMKGVVHRDLKPSNILVGYDGDRIPQPKVIDFGVAKALNQRLSEHTVFTERGQLIGTPEYMSPEQAEMSGVDIDTRSDVYSLGVLLYEILTGVLPFDPHTLRAAAFTEIQRIIREVDPPRPSTRLSTVLGNAGDDDELATRIVRARHTDGKSLSGVLRRDLDWVVMKCLEKDRERRYDTTNALADDLRRYLDGEPVLAGPPSRAYKLRKFVGRNRAGVIAGGVAAAALIAATGISVSFAFAAERARERADEQAAEAQRQADIAGGALLFLGRDMLAAADPWTDSESTGDMTVRQANESAAERLDDAVGPGGVYENEPLIEAFLRHMIGRSYSVFDQHDKADRQLRRAHELRVEHLGEDNASTIFTADLAATNLLSMGRNKEAVEAFEEILAIIEGGEFRPHASDSARFGIAVGQARLGQDEEAERVYREFIDRADEDGEEYSHIAQIAMGNLAGLLRSRDRFDDAIELSERRLEYVQTGVGPDDVDMISALEGLAWSYSEAGQLDDALTHMRRAGRLRERIWGPDHPESLGATSNLSSLFQRHGRYDEAIELQTSEWDAVKRTRGPEHPDAIRAAHRVAQAYFEAERYTESTPIYEELYDIVLRTKGPEDPETVWRKKGLAVSLMNEHVYDRAEKLYDEILAYETERYGEAHTSTINTIIELGIVYEGTGRRTEATGMFRRALALSKEVYGEDNENGLVSARIYLGRRLAFDGRHEEAQEHLRLALESRLRMLGPHHVRTARAKRDLGRSLYRTGQVDEGLKLFQEAYLTFRRALGANDNEVTRRHTELLEMLRDAGRPVDELAEIESLRLQDLRAAADASDATPVQLNEYAWQLLTTEYESLRDAEAGLEYARAALDRDKNLEGSELAMIVDTHAKALSMLGRHREALEEQARALAALPEVSWWSRDSMGDVLIDYAEACGDEDAIAAECEARWAYYRLLATQADIVPRSLNSMAWKLLTSADVQLHNPALARELAQQGIELARKNDETNTLRMVLDTGAEACLRLGDTGAALVMQRDAMSLVSEDALANREYHTRWIAILGAHAEMAEAVAAADTYLAMLEAEQEEDPVLLAGVCATTASELLEQDLPMPARVFAARCAELREDLFEDGHELVWLRHNANSLLGECLLRFGQYAEAEPLLTTAAEHIDPPASIGEIREIRIREAHRRVVALYEAWHEGDPEGGHDVAAARWRAIQAELGDGSGQAGR